jgi:hypothetical protein
LKHQAISRTKTPTKKKDAKQQQQQQQPFI